jgi:outer membrane protein assembly factor BamB
MLHDLRRWIEACLVAAAAMFWTTAPAQVRGDWPQLRGPQGMGVSRETHVPVRWSSDENIVWKAGLPGGGGSTPILVGDRVFLTAYSGYAVPGEPAGDIGDLQRHLLCLDVATGRALWQRDLPAQQPEQETIREGHGYASSTPVSDGQRVYVFFGRSGVYAFSLEGEQLWHADVGSNLYDWGSAASPMLAGDLLVVNASVESKALVALDKSTGREAWRAEGIHESWHAPLLLPLPTPGGGSELVLAIMGSVLGIDPATGEQRWTCETDIGWYMVPGLVADRDHVYCIGGRSGGGLAVRLGGRGDVTRTHRAWTIKKGSNVPSLILHEGHLYWVHENNSIAYCAEAATGKIVYEERLERADQFYASPVLVDGKLYYTTRSGRTFVLPARPEFEVLAVNRLDDRSMFNASPAVGNGCLFLRSDRFLYCIGEQ